MILLCKKSFTLPLIKTVTSFKEGETYLFSVIQGSLVYWYEGKYYEVPINSIISNFKSLI